jgi:hypothetical protein
VKPHPSPIPLSSPTGAVYAYACGRCHEIPSTGQMLDRSGRKGPRADDVKHSKTLAEACCRCRRCLRTLTKGSSALYCAKCTGIVSKLQEALSVEVEAETAAHETAMRALVESGGGDWADAVALRELMSEISEDKWCSGWESGLEVTLWRQLVESTDQITDETITCDEYARLRSLSAGAGGWWIHDHKNRVFVPLARWEAMYAEQKKS